MTARTAALPAFASRPARPRYDSVSKAFHWGTLLLVVALYVTVRLHEASTGAEAAFAIMVHRSTGVALWFLTILRLLWRRRHGTAVPLPAQIGGLQQFAAAVTQGMLYALLLLQPLTGFLMSVARGKGFALFGAGFPALMTRDKALGHVLHDAHEWGAQLFLAAIALHAAAALLHGLRRDGVLGAMVPGAR